MAILSTNPSYLHIDPSNHLTTYLQSHPLILPSIHLFSYINIYLSCSHLFTYTPIHPSSINSSVCLFSSSTYIYLSIHHHRSVHKNLAIYLSIQPPVTSSTRSSRHISSNHLIIHLSYNSFRHSSLHLSILIYVITHVFIHQSISPVPSIVSHPSSFVLLFRDLSQ